MFDKTPEQKIADLRREFGKESVESVFIEAARSQRSVENPVLEARQALAHYRKTGCTELPHFVEQEWRRHFWP